MALIPWPPMTAAERRGPRLSALSPLGLAELIRHHHKPIYNRSRLRSKRSKRLKPRQIALILTEKFS